MTTKTLAEKEADFLHAFSQMIRDISVPGMDRMEEAIALAAYYKAERRGFEPGHELPDWLEAEEEIRSMIASARSREATYRTAA